MTSTPRCALYGCFDRRAGDGLRRIEDRADALGPPDCGAAGLVRRRDTLNAIAPGAVDTPLLGEQLATQREARAVTSFPVPIGGFGKPHHLGEWMRFMVSDAADFLCGSVIFVDGGSDAYFRATHWPRRVPNAGIPRYLYRMFAFRRVRSRRS